MKKPEQDEDLWPIFSTPASIKIKKFWDRSNYKFNPDTSFSFNEMFQRYGNKKKKVKAYFFKLTENGKFYYFKSEKDTIPKGFLQLNEEIQITLESIVIDKMETAIAITISRSNKARYQLFNSESQKIFQLWDILRKLCVINNFDDMFVATELLGKGSFATVYKIRRLLDDEEFAAKFYYKETFQTSIQKAKFAKNFFDKSMIKNEVKILRNVVHPGIIRIHEVYQQKDKIVLIMDLVTGTDLYQLVKVNKNLTENQSCVIISKIASALKCLTDAGYVHRDIKLENIMLTNKTTLDISILDFGFAEKINCQQLLSKAGTPGYIAPEVFADLPYTEKGDVFSLGVIFYSLIGGASPFKGNTFQEIMESNQQAFYQFSKSVWESISNECKDLISKLLESNPSKRLSFSQILEENWLKQQLEIYQQKLNQMVIVTPRNKIPSIYQQFQPFDNQEREDRIKSFFNRSSKLIKSSNSNQTTQQRVQQDDQEENKQIKQQQSISQKNNLKDDYEVPNEIVKPVKALFQNKNITARGKKK